MSSVEETQLIWSKADCVTFDVDSTVCTDEGIDELANYLGVGEKVTQLTNQAMGGTMTFKESLSKRLDIIRPSRQNVTQFITEHPPRLTDGIRELVLSLQQRNIAVYLISGGFHSIIEPVAEELNIPKANIIANKFKFYYDGFFAGFDEDQLTCASMGKAKAIEKLKKEHGFQRLVHVGDGVTDMEASPPADAFIGFGGNKVREAVKEGSQWFISSFRELLNSPRKNY